MNELKIVRATDQLVCNDRQKLINHAIRQAGVLDSHNFKLEWVNEDLTTGYTLRGCTARAAAFMTYSFSHQELGQPSSRLRFNENESYIGIIDGPLEYALRDLSYNQTQISLGTILHRALGNLILDTMSKH